MIYSRRTRDPLGSLVVRSLALLRRVCASIAVLACCGFSPEREVLLSWTAPRQCPQAASVQAALARLLAESSAQAGHAVAAYGSIERTHSRRYRLTLRLRIGGHLAERSLVSRRCEDLARTAAWLIAVAVDPSVRAAEQAQPEVAAADDGASTPVQTPTADSAAPPAPEQRSSPSAVRAARVDVVRSRKPWGPLRGRVGLLAGAFFGAGVGAQAELGGSTGLGIGWFHPELDLAVLLPRSERLPVGATVQLWSLRMGLRLCALWGATLRAGPCLALDGLRVVGHVDGLANLQDRALFWALGGAGLRAFWNVAGRLELAFGAGLDVSLSQRPRFTVEGYGEVATASALTSYVRIGLGFVTR